MKALLDTRTFLRAISGSQKLSPRSLEEGWPVVTSDPAFRNYPVQVIW
jgi:PIN domain nuclease of toxin-antitoxin system